MSFGIRRWTGRCWSVLCETQNADDLVIPSINFLRDNGQLRQKVDTRMQQWDEQQRQDIQGKKLNSGCAGNQLVYRKICSQGLVN